MDVNYKINSQQKGKDIHSKVYLLEELNSGKELIVKIYESSRHKYYQKEKNVLDYIHDMNNNINIKDFFIMYKEMQFHSEMFNIPEEVSGYYNLKFLFFDYISKLSLLDYISGGKQYLEEIHIKYLCYELLTAIKNLHKINIYPNNLDIYNIMLDSNFQLKLIHFCEAEILNNDDNNSKFNNDLFYLGKILAKLISYGKIKTINFNKKKNYFEIRGNFQKNSLEESKFWKMANINITKEFLDFLHILIKAKLSTEIVDIDDLLKNDWLNEITDKYEITKAKFYEDFKKIYQNIIEDREVENKINIDINDIIDINPNKKEDSLLEKIKNPDYLSGDQLALDISEDNNSIIRDNSFYNNNNAINSQIQNLNCQNSDKMNINTNNISNINNNIYSNEIKNINNINNEFNMNNYNSNINNNNHTINMNNFHPMNMMNPLGFGFLNNINLMGNMNCMNGINMNNNINLLGISNKFNSMENLAKNLIDNFNNNFNNSNYSAFNRPKNESVNNNSQLKGLYYHPFENKLNSSYNISSNKSNNNNDLYLINLQKFVKEKGIKVVNKIKNESIPKKYDFNYLEIIIKNNDNIDNNKIEEALNKFIKNYIEKIKSNFSNSNIEIYINNITNFSFNINYNILSIKIDDDDEIIFLDEKYENTIKNGDKYEIKVELIKGKYNNNNLTYQYYLIFKPYGINQEDFYEQIKILKNLAISLLNKK